MVRHASVSSREKPRTSAVIVTAVQPDVLKVICAAPVPAVLRQFALT